jgi:hypothetical protein
MIYPKTTHTCPFSEHQQKQQISSASVSSSIEVNKALGSTKDFLQTADAFSHLGRGKDYGKTLGFCSHWIFLDVVWINMNANWINNHEHGTSPFIDGLPFLKIVDLSSALC